MRNELTLAGLRDAVTPLLAPTVQEESFIESVSVKNAGFGTWNLRGRASGVVCEIDYHGNWFVQLDDVYGVELWPTGVTRLEAFLISFDVKPIELVTARIRQKVVGTWLRFSDGMKFEDPTWRDKRISRRRGYTLEVSPLVAGSQH